MPLRPRSAVLAVLLAPLAALALLQAPAQAAPRSPDPERVVVPAAPAQRTAAAAKAPASIDSDVYAYTVSPTGRTYFAAAGHLRLKPKGGSTTRYSGSFVDYSGGRTTKAGADTTKPDAPTISIKTKNGSFAFRGDVNFGSPGFWSAQGTKVPKGLKAKDVYLTAVAHSLRTSTYQVVFSERVGPVARPLEYSGTMTIAYDANNRVSGGQVTVTNGRGKVVTNAIRSSGYVDASSYFYTVVKVDKTTMAVNGTVSGTSFTGFASSGSGSKTAQWVVTGTA